MAEVFALEDSVFFVGGRGTKAGNALCGGCTKEWYDDNFAELSSIMHTNGEPKYSKIDCESLNTSTLYKDPGAFVGVEAGMIAYLFGTNVATGRYKIIEIVDSGTIRFAGSPFAAGPGTDIVCNIGGAFDSLQNAADNTDATNHDVFIFDNKGGALGVSIDIDTTGGSITNKSAKVFIGFDTTPEDGELVTYTGKGFVFGTIENIFMSNVKVTNLNVSGFFCSALNTKGITLFNCHVDNSSIAGLWNGGFYVARGYGMICINCTAKNISTAGFRTVYGGAGGAIHCINCYAYNCEYGFYSTGGYAASSFGNCIANECDNAGFYWLTSYYSGLALKNCVAYNCGGNGFEQFDVESDCAVTLINCIAKDNTGHGFKLTNGPIPILLNCNSHGNGTNYDAVLDTLYSLIDCIEEDPSFVDAANGDFTPRNPNVLRGGKPDINGNFTPMGAIFVPQNFSRGSRVFNPGRISTIRN